MATREPLRVSDGQLECSGGVDSGLAPNLLRQNQLSFMINGTTRGGWPMCRPGVLHKIITFDTETTQEDFEDGRFQFAGGYTDDSSNGFLIGMHNGRQIKIAIETFAASDISIPGDLNPKNRQMAWGAQGENYFIIQDGQTLPFIHNGATSRRATEKEIPVGRQIVYYMGRLWVANGRTYRGGDIVNGPSGTSGLQFRDSMLKFTENTFLNEGGDFGVPMSAGDITALVPMANLNTALGQGDLIVGTRDAIFATAVPPDRETWKNTSEPLQRVIQINYGMVNQDSCVNVNGDLFYRSTDGWRSLKYAVRYFDDWGNTPISREMNRILDADAPDFLQYTSGVLFDNRLLGTASPTNARGHGFYHRCLCPLDYDLISSMAGKLPPAWEGIWTGLRYLKVLKVKHQGVDRCFYYVLNPETNKVELWEQTKAERFDDTDKRIEWSFETRSMNFGNPFDRKKLDAGDFFFDRLAGKVNSKLEFRPDSHPCWIPWDSWTECAKYRTCDDFGTCPTLAEYKEQYRPKRQFVQPPDTADENTLTFFREFYELQTRHTFVGFCRAKQIRYNALITQEQPFGKQLP